MVEFVVASFRNSLARPRPPVDHVVLRRLVRKHFQQIFLTVYATVFPILEKLSKNQGVIGIMNHRVGMIR